jgi:hypothetical protein
MPWPRRRRAIPLLAAAIVLAIAGAAQAQRFFYREGSFPARYAPENMPDAGFTVCRLEYRQVRREQSGIGWRTDYPFAEINLLTRLSELTKVTISRDSEKEPNTWVVQIGQDALFNCPFMIASDAGTMAFTDEEATRLRQYLLKGGFFWVDDFWGSAAWEHWEEQISRVFPPSEFPIEDVRLDDPLLKSMFEVKELPQITSIQFWTGFGGRQTTSERGADSDEVHLRAIRDANRRIMVLMTHNTDVADSWEREGEDPDFFYQFSPKGYALGIDVLIHAMTH